MNVCLVIEWLHKQLNEDRLNEVSNPNEPPYLEGFNVKDHVPPAATSGLLRTRSPLRSQASARILEAARESSSSLPPNLVPTSKLPIPMRPIVNGRTSPAAHKKRTLFF
jgi:hypothetical protein